jgi:hypothetical protein
MPEQLGLFNYDERGMPEPRRDLVAEAAARDEGIAKAMGGAPVGWAYDALLAVQYVAERRFTLTADHVWDRLAEVGARTPPTRSALAGVLKRAGSKRMAWIEPTDNSTMSEGDGRHRSRIMVWRSLICSAAFPEDL